ncbi:Citrate synthase 1 [Enhygromyxa salina]|uniref:Citrate synthase n=1 Tax=Enhygromyxa salina TaxID=215803 RepID=A0A2S9YF39_9BACT|nr:Citrate synthase 1 [Enhygromyxa salina]
MAQTRLSRVDGEAGRLTLAGFELEDLAPKLGFEGVAALLWTDSVLAPAPLEAFVAELAGQRALEPVTVDLLRRAAAREVAPIDALRLGVASLSLGPVSGPRLLAAVPTIVATYDRLRRGAEPLAPDPALSLAADFLRMATGTAPTPGQTRALDTYLSTIADHGLNASTFTARVVASTRAELGPAIEAAIAALGGPLHGGAPGPALEALLELREQPGDLEANTRTWATAQLAAGERIMGFGHRVYRTRDPRADVLGAAAAQLLAGTGLYEDAQIHERAVLEVLRAHKPGRVLATNVEFYTALLLHGLGFEPAVFTSIFAIGRTAGWIAHYEEQQREGRLIRPRAAYVGARGRTLC